MSLIVTALRENSNSNEPKELVIDKNIANDLAGFEEWRETLYGSEVLKELGCEILPELKEDNIYALGDDILKLKRDCHLILSHIRFVAEKTELDGIAIVQRVNNILVAADEASKYSDGAVSIS